MPQLDILTYMTQLVWLFIILGSFYVILVKSVLPQIKRTNKVRTLVKGVEEEVSKGEELPDTKTITEAVEITNKLMKEEIRINQNMINENIKMINNKELLKIHSVYLETVATMLIEKNE